MTIGFAQSKSLASGHVVLLPVKPENMQMLLAGEKYFITLPGQHLAHAPRPPGRIWQVLVDKVFFGFITGKVV